MTRARLARPLREIAVVGALYALYSLVRNLLGNDRDVAARNAWRIVDLERALGLFHEGALQRALDHAWLMQALNTFYGLAHFAVTGAVLVWLYHRRASYSVWRTALASTTFLALIGYALFPLMPPRLLPGSGIADALAVHGGPWSYEHGPISGLSNQFAAMPSLHVAWALWCAAALWVEGRRRVAAVGYSLVTVVAVVATGNHYVVDAVGGAAVLAAGFAIARRRARRSEAVVAAVDGDDVGGVVAARMAGEVDREPAEVLT